MNVLVACEESQVVCKSFRAKGHNAWSCDLQPCSGGRPEWHFEGDCMPLLNEISKIKWDIVIAHPPCTYLCNSGVRWLYNPDGRINKTRWEKMEQAAWFFRFFIDLPGMVAVENPIMHKHAQTIIQSRHTQIIQPWQFGHGETKATCLWLNGLPLLKPTKIVDGRYGRIHKLPPSKNRSIIRSKTYQGIADAMAEQWGK